MHTVQHPGAAPARTWDKPVAVSDPICSLKGTSCLESKLLPSGADPTLRVPARPFLCCETPFLWPPLETLLTLGATWALGWQSLYLMCSHCISCSRSDARALTGNVSILYLEGSTSPPAGMLSLRRHLGASRVSAPLWGRPRSVMPLVVASGSALSFCKLVVA